MKSNKDLLRTYRSLPYILHKKKYLIPQKPQSLYRRPPSTVSRPLEALSLHFPSKITPQLIDESEKDVKQQAARQLYMKLYE